MKKPTIYDFTIYFLIILILFSALTPKYGFGAKALIPVLVSVTTTIILDLIIVYFKNKKNLAQSSIFFPKSALISGLFIGGLLSQSLYWYIYVIAGAIAILSKHIIRIQKRHIFNPANFGILLISAIFRVPHTWWIASPLILALGFGIFIIWKLNRIGLSASFLAAYFLIISAIGLLNGAQFLELYYAIVNGGVIYFFSMFMLTEPKTTPLGSKKRIVYGILVAVLFITFQFYVPAHDLPLALAVGNVFVPLLNRVK